MSRYGDNIYAFSVLDTESLSTVADKTGILQRIVTEVYFKLHDNYEIKERKRSMTKKLLKFICVYYSLEQFFLS